MNDEMIKEFLDRIAKAGISVTTGVSTSKNGNNKYWEWWDSDGGNARGKTVSGLVERLSEKERRIEKED